MCERKQKVEHSFKNREHLLECITRSSHIPFISTDKLKHDNRYVDGVTPYIFRDGERKAIFVMLVTRKKLKHFISFKSQTNSYSRLLAGVADADNFFTCGNSDMCSYVDKWSFLLSLSFSIREFVFFLIVWLVELGIYLYSNIPKHLTNMTITHGIEKALSLMYYEILFRLVS
jgi:hypothetical protein